jgi:Arc/MetJ-type ribon-helix-helix transcriptional regulator
MKLTQKVQLDREDLDFIDRVCETLDYGSKSEYMRAAIREKIRADKRKLRELERQRAMEGYAEGYEDVFECIAGETFEER